MTTKNPAGKHYVVEHLEPEIGAWSELEYTAIARETVPPSTFHITSVPPSLTANLPQSIIDSNALVTAEEVVAIIRAESANSNALTESAGGSEETAEQIIMGRVCLLDPAADVELEVRDAGRFDCENGRMLMVATGDDPPRDRTAELRKYGFARRRLGPVQMTTDTAVRVTRLIVEQQMPYDKIPYVDHPELRLTANETTEMPFRYVKNLDGTPVMPEGMLDLIKKDSSKGFGDMF